MIERTLVQMFFNRVRRYEQRIALKVKIGGHYHDISWSQVGEVVRFTASGLIELGLKKGERVAILSENRPEWIYADLGILSLGAISVPVYATNPAAQVKVILEDSQVTGIFVSNKDQLGKIVQMSGHLPWLR